MIERGITNAKADVWMHLFPFQGQLFWYVVRHMREYLDGSGCAAVETIGHSADGAETGRGFLVDKALPFIQCVDIQRRMLDAFDWAAADTDKKLGLEYGEKLADWLMSLNMVRLPAWTVHRISSKQDQIHGGDFGLQFMLPRALLVEVKTERIASGRLFVQTHEGGHRHSMKRSTTKLAPVSEDIGLL